MKYHSKILLVEDDVDFGNVLQQYLELNGFITNLAGNGRLGLKIFKDEDFDLVILDVMMPELDGFICAEQMQRLKPHIPFIFLTAKTQKKDIIKGLKLGADDYISKPFDAEELILRMNNILKRREKQSPGPIKLGHFDFDLSNHTLKINNQEIQLTPKESQILGLLSDHRNQLVRKADILKALWGEEDYFTARSLDVFISRLRKYLQQDNSIEIVTIHKTGYKLRM